ncbi:MAG: hypothetical protein ACI38A_08155, partial [Candidatus Ornithomonoglobus sp.]
KIISSILSISILAASSAVPVFADYAPADYDYEQLNYTYDDGAVTNEIDGSPAKQVTDSERLIELDDSTILTNEFFLSFDFRFDSAEDGSVPGIIQIDKKKSSGDADKYGPIFSYEGGVLRTQTGSTSYQTVASISPDVWYTAEIEGKMVVTDAAAVMRVYSYEDGEKTLVNELEGLNLRQFYAGAGNGNPNCLRANNVSIDNLTLISEYPDTITVTAAEDTVNAGQTDALDYSMSRLDMTVTKYAVTWSVYDADDSEEITDGSVTVTEEGVLSASISSPSQVVTVRAAAEFGGRELYGSKQITINAVDTDSEKYDEITIIGDDTVKAGTETAYSFTASKGGADVTGTVTDSDIVWSIYNCEDLKPNNNAAIKAENGILTVGDGVLPQTIYLRAASPSGNVYGSKKVDIELSASQEETVLASTACETAFDGMERVDSWDGSTAYYSGSALHLITLGANQTDYVFTELDVRFGGEGSGFTLMRRDAGKTESCFRYHNGQIALQTSSSNYDMIMSADTDTWYHFEVLYSSANEDASCNIYPINADGTLGEKQTALGISRRNGAEYGMLQIEAGTYVDNVKLSAPIADDVTVTAPGQYMFAGDTAQFTATATRSGLPLKNASGLTWTVLDAGKLPIIDGSITVDAAGLVTVDATAPAQTIYVEAKSSEAAKSSAAITVQVSEIFSVTNLGINEAGTAVTKVYVDKNFYYNDDVVFIITVKGNDGVLKAVGLINTFGDRLNIGSNELAADMTLPADFNPETDRIEAMVWTTF